MSYLLQIQLKQVIVIENGKVEKDIKGLNGLSASLYYPKSGVPTLESVRTLRLKDREPLEFKLRPISEKLLFKQEIQGDTMLQVKITAIEKVDKFEKAALKIIGKVAVAAVGAITGVGAVLTATATGLVGSIFDEAELKDTINIIGEGVMPITEDTPEGDVIVQLAVPNEIKLQQAFEEDGKLKKKILTLKEGYSNAMVIFELKRLDKEKSKSEKQLLA